MCFPAHFVYCNLLESWSLTLKRGRSVVGFPLFEGVNENFAFTVLTTFPMTTNVSKEIKKLTYITYVSVWTWNYRIRCGTPFRLFRDIGEHPGHFWLKNKQKWLCFCSLGCTVFVYSRALLWSLLVLSQRTVLSCSCSLLSAVDRGAAFTTVGTVRAKWPC